MIWGRPVVLRRLSMVAAVGAGPVMAATFVTGSSWWVTASVGAAVVVALGVIDAVAAPSPAAVTVVRLVPGVARVGDTVVLTWSFRNTTRRPVTVAWAEDMAPSLGGERRGVITIDARSDGEASTSMVPTRRGSTTLGPITLRVAGPLGLCARQAQVGGVDAVHIRPDVSPTRPRRAARSSQGRRGTGAHSSPAVGGAGDFEQLRDYIAGDDPRLIDWNATARLDRPIMRTQRTERYRPVTVLVDTGRTMAGGFEGPPTFDQVIRAVVGFAAAVDQLGDRVGLLVYDALLRAEVAPRRGRGLVATVMSELMSVEPTLREADHAGALATVMGRDRGRSTVVMFTELDAPVVEERLLPALAAHRGSGSVIVAALRDPHLENLAAGGDLSSSSLALAAAAARRLDERLASARAIESLGVTVVDATPSCVVPGLVAAYQGMRSRETGANRPRSARVVR